MTEQVPMIRCGNEARPYAEVAGRTARIASGLRGLGVKPEGRVGLLMYNDISFIEVIGAASLIGAASVPFNWHLRPNEVRYLVENSEASVIFVHTPLLAVAREAAPDRILVEVAIPGIAPQGDALLFEEWLAEQAPYAAPPESAPLSVIYTSGTTGSPKGVLREPISPDHQLQVAGLVVQTLAMKPGHRTLVVAPMYHSAPNAQAAFAAKMGLDITIMPRFDAEEMLALIERQRINHVQLVPTHFVRLLALPAEVRARYDLSSLEAIVHAAAPCPPQVKQQIIDWLGPIVHEFYGGTETGAVVASTSAEWLAHPGTVGKPMFDASVRILDPDRQPLPAGESGEIFVKPPSFWPDFTFIGDPDKRARMDFEGHVSIGDIGYLDSDGFLYLNDRAIDMVISGGVNIYPTEIENALLSHDGVRDAAVFGIPDADLGEKLVAHIDVDPDAGLDEDAIRRYLGEQLAKFKVPRVIVFDDKLPREASGKLMKRRIRQRYLDAMSTSPS
ncbi:AMP-binding protein [Antrihabitans sp. YC2-6]|uniref:AMP-binding protein n=1 Tax=Antrihabitans sp. YC2-6 TaxID=2799498 RepID=UPI0018F541A6|nr:AMP-binding protein [Antrihabitans sp. YC2-6]MBJ8343855.1 AMP-binding protein [Antrihabitans sp. YC2-6]